ncbi:MAG: RDD family protein [Burkholderiales bacterium]
MTDNAAPRAPKYVGFWKRVLATLIDTVVMAAVIVPLLYAFYGSSYFKLNLEALLAAARGSAPAASSRPLFAGPADVFINLLPIVALVLFWRFRGATPGKMLVGARIVDARTLGKPSTGQLIGRFFAYLISILPACLGLLWVAFDKRKQGWHDKLAGTVVIEDED